MLPARRIPHITRFRSTTNEHAQQTVYIPCICNMLKAGLGLM